MYVKSLDAQHNLKILQYIQVVVKPAKICWISQYVILFLRLPKDQNG